MARPSFRAALDAGLADLEAGRTERGPVKQEPAGVSIDTAWAMVEAALPDGYFISALRTRSKKARWSASATLDLDISGANWSGFGPTPGDALLDLRAKLMDRDSYKNPSTGPERHARYTEPRRNERAALDRP